jgi:8-oxo-dGTP diphosphatase
VPTVDVVIFHPVRGVVLVERAGEPLGWALPGGFVEYGETVETAAVREAAEETGLEVVLTSLLGVYSDPARDPRKHTMSVVFTAQARDPDALSPGSDAGDARFFPLGRWPGNVVFDHPRILSDFMSRLGRLNPSMNRDG